MLLQNGTFRLARAFSKAYVIQESYCPDGQPRSRASAAISREVRFLQAVRSVACPRLAARAAGRGRPRRGRRGLLPRIRISESVLFSRSAALARGGLGAARALQGWAGGLTRQRGHYQGRASGQSSRTGIDCI